ncbi:hypothetical protein ES706_04244 [subsurface metagenome]
MRDVWSLYSDKVMEHFKNPRNVGEIENPDGIGHVGNPVCGDIMELYIKVNNGTIVDAKFKTFGCGAAIATSSMVTEMVKGKSIGEALEISNRAVAEALDGLPPIKMHCSVLAEEALKSAIEDYLSKQRRRCSKRRQKYGTYKSIPSNNGGAFGGSGRGHRVSVHSPGH